MKAKFSVYDTSENYKALMGLANMPFQVRVLVDNVSAFDDMVEIVDNETGRAYTYEEFKAQFTDNGIEKPLF